MELWGIHFTPFQFLFDSQTLKWSNFVLLCHIWSPFFFKILFFHRFICYFFFSSVFMNGDGVATTIVGVFISYYSYSTHKIDFFPIFFIICLLVYFQKKVVVMYLCTRCFYFPFIIIRKRRMRWKDRKKFNMKINHYQKLIYKCTRTHT